MLQCARKAAAGAYKPDARGEILEAIPDADLELLWQDATVSRPEDMVLTHLIVPPVSIRPSVIMEGAGSNEDDLTMKLTEIINVNHTLSLALEQGGTLKAVAEHWDFLQVQVAHYINGELPGFSMTIKKEKSIRGLVQRMKGKRAFSG